MKPFTVYSCAKVNLTLDVLARRSDGYHELQSVVHAVGLWDELHFDFDFESPDGFTVTCDDKRLEGSDNLIFKAMRAWLLAAENYRARLPRMHVRLKKHIPMGAGLGGGSGNAAATLRALNYHYRELLDEKELLRVAARVGADVPLFLRGGCVLMEGIGEKLSPLPTLEGWLVIVQPPRGLSTPEIYRAWDESHEVSQRATPQMLQALGETDLSGVGLTLADLTRPGLQQVDVATPRLKGVAAALGNDLERAARPALPELAQLVALLRAYGALNAQVTGSGSAVFGLFEDEEEARQVAATIAVRHLDGEHSPKLSFVGAAPFCGNSLRFAGQAG